MQYEYKFDVELVETVFSQMKRGKAAGLDELTIEHLVHSHPVLVAILSKFFNLIISAAYIPYGFRLSYTVPLPRKNKVIRESLSIIIGRYQLALLYLKSSNIVY